MFENLKKRRERRQSVVDVKGLTPENITFVRQADGRLLINLTARCEQIRKKRQRKTLRERLKKH
jgi:hypothetical protein